MQTFLYKYLLFPTHSYCFSILNIKILLFTISILWFYEWIMKHISIKSLCKIKITLYCK
jgi:hypothetical protein